MKIVVNGKKFIYTAVAGVLWMLLVAPEGIYKISPLIAKLLWSNTIQLLYIPIFVLLVFIKRKNYRTVPLTFLPIGYIVVVFFLTLLNGGSIVTFFENYSRPLCGCLLFFCFSDHLEELLNALLIYFGILILLNLVCMFLYPDGMYITEKTRYYLNWLLGYKSSLQYYIYPFVTVILLKVTYNGFRIYYIGALVLAIYTTFKSENMMLLVGLLIIILIVVLGINRLKFIFNGFTCLLVSIVSNVIVLFMMKMIIFSSWGQKLVNVLGKDFTFSGRANIIWPAAIHNIMLRPLTGYGILEADRVRNMLKMPAAIHAHNQFLDVMLNGGIGLLIVYGGVLYLIASKLTKYADLKSAKILCVCLLGLYIMVIFEVFTRGISSGIWLMFCLALHPQVVDMQLGKNIKIKKKKKKRKIIIKL